ncbi:MAG: hypothetical protein ABL928_13065 [Sphingorhabdus sp.]
MIKRNFALIALLSLSACVTTAGTEAPLPDGTNVPMGRSAYVDGPIIRPVKVLEDSRCPMNARCIWAGTVKIEAIWERRSGDRTVELELGKAVPLADGTLELTDVSPSRMAGEGRELKPADYRFSFRFMGGT